MPMSSLAFKNRKDNMNESGYAVGKPVGKSLLTRVMDHWELYVLLLPVVVLVILFSYFPMYGVLMAFQDFKVMDGIMNSKWVGLNQFYKLFNSTSFWEVLQNTIVISFYRLLFGFPAPIIFAILLNEVINTKFKKIVQTVSYLPHFMSWVVLGGIIYQLLSMDRGVVNYVIKLMGGEPIMFLADTSWFRTILISTGVWQSVGWSSVIYLANIAGIDPQLYEAARMDGANRYHMMVHITLPCLYPVMTILLILQMGGILNAGFDQVFNLYSPMVYKVGDILDTYVYRRGISEGADYSFTTAVGLFKNVIGFVMVILTNMFSKKFSDNGIW